MKKRILISALTLILAASFQLSALNIKMASLLPEGSEWDLQLKEMASNWREITDGRIKIKIYPGGIAGGESDVIRKMRIGQIDMAVLTSVGITNILPDTFAMSMPFMLESEEELDFIVKEVTPIFDEALREKGFIVLTWSKSGWVNFFSKDKIVEPQDMMPMKFAGSVTQPELAETFRQMGFNVVSIDTPDVLMALQSGMVESLYAPTMAAASYQWFGLANNMLDMKVAPMLGGIVISEKAWRKIPEKYKEELIMATHKLSEHFYKEAQLIEEQALEVMLKNGLEIHSTNHNTIDNWRALLGDDFSVIVGQNGFVSEDSFNSVYSMLKEYRRR